MNHLNLRCDEVSLGDQLRSYMEQRLEASIERRNQRQHEKRKGGK
jgi:hypothetical protein